MKRAILGIFVVRWVSSLRNDFWMDDGKRCFSDGRCICRAKALYKGEVWRGNGSRLRLPRAVADFSCAS